MSVKLVFSYQYYPYFDYYNQKIISFVESFHPYDDVVFIIFQIVQVLIVGAIPAEISGFVGGYLYGPIIGTIYSTRWSCYRFMVGLYAFQSVWIASREKACKG